MDVTPEFLRTEYEKGATIESLSLDYGKSMSTIRKLLIQAGTEIRKGGGSTHDRPKSGPYSDPKVERPTGVHKIRQIGPPLARGKRRRGRKP
jgi:hypothetical protein